MFTTLTLAEIKITPVKTEAGIDTDITLSRTIVYKHDQRHLLFSIIDVQLECQTNTSVCNLIANKTNTCITFDKKNSNMMQIEFSESSNPCQPRKAVFHSE